MINVEQKLPDDVEDPSEPTKSQEPLYNAWEQRFNEKNKYHDDF